MYKAIIFDLDGTLVDTIDSITHGLNLMLSELGYPQISRDKTLASINNGGKKLVYRVLPDSVRDDEGLFLQAYSLYCQKYKITHLEVEKPYENIYETLEGLLKKDVRLGILSNKQDEFVTGICKKLFVNLKISQIRGQREGEPTKPCPKVPLEISSLLGAKPSECVFVGDSDIDMETARACGFLPLGVSWGYRSREILEKSGAAIVVDSPLEILELFN